MDTDTEPPLFPTDTDKPVLGETRGVIDFSVRTQNRELAAVMAEQATRALCLWTPDLEAPIYDSRDFIRAVTQLATRSRFSQIRILIQDAGHVMKHGHRLVEVARRFSSSIFMHRPAPEQGDSEDSFLIADDCGYIYKDFANRYEGRAEFNNRYECQRLLKRFDEMWEESEPETELRRLHL